MKSKSFRFLWIGQAFADLGDVLYIVGLISILYLETHSVFYLTFLPFLNTTGRFISGLLSPLMFDRFPLKQLLAGSQLLKTGVLIILGLVTVFSGSQLWIILMLVFLIAFLDGWAAPSSTSMIPRLVEEHEIVTANSFLSVVRQTLQLGGWAAGGILVVIIGGKMVIWVTLCLYIVSTGMMVLLKDPFPFQPREEKGDTWDALKEGWKLIWQNPLLRMIHVMIFFEAIANVVWIAAILYVFVTEVLHATESWWGYINTSFFLGLIIGGMIGTRFSSWMEAHLKKILILSSGGVSLITFIFGFNSMALIALLFAGFHGIIDQMKAIVMETHIQKSTAVNELPKIYGAQHSLVSITFGLSSLIFGVLAEQIGVRNVFLLAGFLLGGSAVYAMLKHRYLNGEAYSERS